MIELEDREISCEDHKQALERHLLATERGLRALPVIAQHDVERIIQALHERHDRLL